MRKLLFLIAFSGLVFLKGYSQTTADFVNDTVCFGSTTTMLSISTSPNTILGTNWDIDSNGVFDDDTGLVVKFIFPAEKDYRVGVQVITSVDTDVVYKTVVVYPKPVVDFNIDFPTQCLSSNFFSYTNLSTIASGTMTNFWDLDEGKTDTNINTTATYSIAGTKNIKLVVTSDEGCADSTTQIALVTTISDADFIINDSLQCFAGNYFVFTDNSLTCDPLTELAWDLDNNGTFTDSVNKNSVAVSFPAPGTYTIGMRMITTGGRDSVYKTVTVYPSAVVGFTTNDTTQCEGGNSFDFTNSSTLTSGTMSYYWRFGNGDTMVSQDVNGFNYDMDGDFRVSLMVTTDMGCVDSAIRNVHVFASPYADFDFNDSILCLGDTFFFTNYSGISTPWVLTYQWDLGDGAGYASSKDTQYLYTGAGIYTVSLVATSDSGCTDTFFADMQVITSSQARFDINDSTQCLSGNSFTFTEASANCFPVDTVLWDLNKDGVFGDTSGYTFDYSFSAAGTYSIGMQLITNKDTSVAYRNVYVYPSPIAAFSVNDTSQVIASNYFIFTNTSTLSTGTLSYFWDLGDSTFATSKDTSHIYAALGTYKVRLFVASDMGCMDSVEQNVHVVSPINPGFIATTVCLGDSTTLTDTSQSAQPIIAYNWDLDGDGVFGDTTGKVLKVLAPFADTFLVGLQVVTASSSAFIYDTVVVLPVPKAGFEFTKACQGAATTFTDKSSPGGTTITKYYWDFDNNNIVDDSSGKLTSFQYTNAGNFQAALTVKTSDGCTDKSTQTVSVFFQPNADFTFGNACVGDSVEFKNTSTIGGLDSIINFHWDYGDGTDAIIRRDHKHIYTIGSTFNVILTTLSANGCYDSTSHTLTIYPKPSPSLSFSGDTIFFEGQDVTITVSGSYPGILWSTGETTPGITVDQSGIYTVTVTSSDNCEASRSALIEVKSIPEVEVVDIFTPNGDGVNDYLIIDNLTAFQPVVLTIYNRYGDEVFTTNDYQNDWDGKFKGKVLPEGTYYYILKTKDGKMLKGVVNIIK